MGKSKPVDSKKESKVAKVKPDSGVSKKATKEDKKSQAKAAVKAEKSSKSDKKESKKSAATAVEAKPAKVEKKEKKSKKSKKEPTPPPSSSSESESDDSSDSDSDSEMAEAEPTKASRTVAKATDSDSDSDSSASGSDSDSEEEAAVVKAAKSAAATTKNIKETVTEKVNGAKKAVSKAAETVASAVDADSDSDSDSSSGSDSDSDSEETPVAKGAKKAVESVKATAAKATEGSDDSSDDSSDSDSASSSSDDEEEKPATKRKAEESTEAPAAKKAATSTTEGESCTIFVGRLSWNIDDEWLGKEFESVGTVVSSRVVMDRASGKSKGFGYVEFDSAESAKKALEMNGQEIDGRPVNIDISTPRPAQNNNRASAHGDVQSPPSSVVFIGNLSFESNEDAVYEAFGECGEIQSVRLPTDRETGAPKGFGYVQFSSVEGAKAMVAMNGHYIGGRPVRLDFSQPRDDSAGGGARGGRGGARGGMRGGRGGRGGFGGDRGGRGGGRMSGPPRQSAGAQEFKGTKVSFD